MLPMDVIFYPLIQGQTESKLEQKWIQGKNGEIGRDLSQE